MLSGGRTRPYLRVFPQTLNASPGWQCVEVIIDFDGPRIALWSRENTLYLGVAADEDSEAVRWIAGRISEHEKRALLSGAITVYDALAKNSLAVFDCVLNGDISQYNYISLSDVPLDALPDVDALLPAAVLEAYQSTSHEASLQHPPRFILDGDSGMKERSLRVLCDFLGPLQKLFDALGQRLEAEPTARGSVEKGVRLRTELCVTAVSAGSAVIDLATSDQFLFTRIIHEIRSLALLGRDKTEISDILVALGPRVRSIYSDLVATIDKHDVSVFCEGSTAGAYLSTSLARRAKQYLTTEPETDSEEIDLSGYFIAFDTRAGTFEFAPDDDEEIYKGTVAKDCLDDNEKVVVGRGICYVVGVELKSVRYLGAECSFEYLLRRIALKPD